MENPAHIESCGKRFVTIFGLTVHLLGSQVGSVTQARGTSSPQVISNGGTRYRS